MHGRARAGIGYLPQEASIFRKLSVSDNIMAILETRSDLDRTVAKALEGLLQEFHIHHIRQPRHEPVRRRTTPGGNRPRPGQRAEIHPPRRAASPAWTRSQSATSKQIIHHLKAKGIGILITDHNVRETLDICETAYIVNDGQLIAEGDAESILANDLVKEVYLGHEFRL